MTDDDKEEIYELLFHLILCYRLYCDFADVSLVVPVTWVWNLCTRFDYCILMRPCFYTMVLGDIAEVQHVNYEARHWEVL